MPARKVTKIEGRASLFPAQPGGRRKKKRVAAYARVSTDSDEQLSSYGAQVDFYTRYIRGNPEWEFVSVYTDEGISGTNTKRREGFNRMVDDALEGKIDLILTKSISRFARNTVDTLATIRKLKEKGVEVYFEKENIYTLDSKGEVMLTIMSSLAQEESRSISENVRWGMRRNMEDGKVSLAYSRFLGYEKGEDGIPRIVESEAETVREIYRLYLEGYTFRAIARHLTDQGIQTPSGRDVWSVSTVESILQNEKYKGDALLQKTYISDFLSKKVKINRGELPQYYIHNSHPAIIDPDTFELVQNEIARRRPKRRQLYKCSPFAAKITCGECGGCYGRKVWHSGSKYSKVVWRCNRKYDGGDKCSTPNLFEEELEQAFVKAFNLVLGEKEKYIARFEELLPLLADTSGLERQQADAQERHGRLLGELKKCMEENARQIQDQEEYNRRFTSLSGECEDLEEIIARLQGEILEQQGRREQIRRTLDELRGCGEILDEFDAILWNNMVDKVTASTDKTLTFLFKDGTRIPVKLPEND